MDQTVLRNADLLILTALTQTPAANPDSMLGEFCMAVGNSSIVLALKGVVNVSIFALDSVHFESGRLLPRSLPSFRAFVRSFRMLVSAFG